MSTTIYTRLRSLARKLLTKYGQDETLYSPSGSPSYTVKAVFLPLETSSTKQDIQIEFDLQNTEAERIIIYSATELTIVPGWYITKNATTRLTISQVTNIKPTNTQLYYDCIGQR